MLYCEKDSDSLTDLRYLQYMKMASSSRTIKPEGLPLTKGAAMFHPYQLYFQPQEQNRLMESTLDPKDWAQRLEGASLVPVMMDEEPTPDTTVESRRKFRGMEMGLTAQLLEEDVAELNVKVV